MRCPTCSKFVAYNTEEEPEVTGEPEISDDGFFTMTVRRVLTCEECGDELKEAELELTQNIGDKPCTNEAGHEWEVEVDVTPTDFMDNQGGKIKHARYMKHMYGAEVTGTATCAHCQTKVTIEASDAVSASSMDELV